MKNINDLSIVLAVSLYFLFFVNHAQLDNFDLQFHPESVATSHGSQIFKNFREITDDYWLRFRSSYNEEKRANSDGKLKNFLYRDILHLSYCMYL